MSENLYLKDTKGRITWINNAYMKTLGVDDKQEALQKSDSDFFGKEYAAKTHKDEQEIIRTGKALIRKLEEVKLPGGKKCCFLTTKIALHDSGSDPIGIFGISSDITKIKEERDRLEEEKILFEDLFENASEMIITTDTQGFITRVNKKVVDTGGYSKKELIGKNILKLAHKDDIKKYIEIWEKNLAGKEIQYEGRNITKDGKLLYCLTTGRPIKKGGKVVAFQYNSQDITEHKALETKLHQTAHIEAIGRLAGGIAHDFNNLLTVINGHTEILIQSTDKDDPAYKKLLQIYKAGQKASEMTNQILAFSKKQRVEKKIVDVNAEISNMKSILQKLMGENIELIVHTTPEIGNINIDPAHLTQIILNLAINAKDAMPEGGEFTIYTDKVSLDKAYCKGYTDLNPGKYIMISVKDTGIGIRQDVKEHIFEPFFSTKEKDIGTGLGLSTVYGIVKQYKGEVVVESEPDKGSIFKIFLPWAEEEVPEKKDHKVKKSHKEKQKTILVVEDEDTVRDLIIEILSQRGYKVLSARNGGDALQLARGYPGQIDLLLTDIIMRRIDGKMLSKRMLSIKPDIKVMYMSGYTGNVIGQDEIKDIEFLQKPFLPDDLLRKVENVLAKN
ncbi:MAG: PAS domain S-box protein [Deltaproteobacteria bacterium]|nr:PAS domain S-box protein [Deltaproteobacteria bacterium]